MHRSMFSSKYNRGDQSIKDAILSLNFQSRQVGHIAQNAIGLLVIVCGKPSSASRKLIR